MTSARPAFVIGGEAVAAGTRRTVNLPVSVLSDHTPVTLSVHVVHGRRPGPTLFVSASVHGDEVIGVEIVRRLLRAPGLAGLRGTLLAVPIVNTFGFMSASRYLPDRRDLNRTFPGSAAGSLAARLAHIFLTEVVSRADVGIDLHSAAVHRTNFPQIRVAPGSDGLMHLARAFGAPVILTSKLRDGSLRQVARGLGVEMLLYEAGEGLRFDEFAARVGFAGIQRVMRSLGMTTARGPAAPRAAPLQALSSYWLRAPAGGLLRPFHTAGEQVHEGDVLGIISDPFGEVETEVLAEDPGLIVGRTNLPVVNEGDGLFHIARLQVNRESARTLDAIASQIEGEALFDEDEII